MDVNWGKVWPCIDGVLSDDGLKDDLREKAKETIVSYLKLYEDDAKE